MVKGRGQRISLFLYILSVLMRHLISDKKEVHYIHWGIHFIFDSNLLSFQKWVDCSKPWVLNFYFWGNGDIYSKVVKQCLAPYMKKCIKTYCVCVCVHISIYKCSFFFIEFINVALKQSCLVYWQLISISIISIFTTKAFCQDNVK